MLWECIGKYTGLVPWIRAIIGYATQSSEVEGGRHRIHDRLTLNIFESHTIHGTEGIVTDP